MSKQVKSVRQSSKAPIRRLTAREIQAISGGLTDINDGPALPGNSAFGLAKRPSQAVANAYGLANHF